MQNCLALRIGRLKNWCLNVDMDNYPENWVSNLELALEGANKIGVPPVLEARYIWCHISLHGVFHKLRHVYFGILINQKSVKYYLNDQLRATHERHGIS